MKKIIALLTAAFMLFSVPAAAEENEITYDTFTYDVSATDYIDVSEDDWFYQNLIYLASYDLINGYPDGSFKPNATITLGEYLTLLYGIRDLNLPSLVPTFASESLTDVHYSDLLKDASQSFTDEHWANQALARALTDGLLEAGDYDLNAPVDRELATVLASREAIVPWILNDAIMQDIVTDFSAYLSEDEEMPETYQTLLLSVMEGIADSYEGFTYGLAYEFDYSSFVYDWSETLTDLSAEDYPLFFALDYELSTGYPDNTFKKYQPLKRSEAITLLARLDYLGIYYDTAYDLEYSLSEQIDSEAAYKQLLAYEFPLETLNDYLVEDFHLLIGEIEDVLWYSDYEDADFEAILTKPMSSNPYKFKEYNTIVEALYVNEIIIDEFGGMTDKEKLAIANKLQLRKVDLDLFLDGDYSYNHLMTVVTDDFYIITKGYNAGTVVYLNPEGINYYGATSYGYYLTIEPEDDQEEELTEEEAAYDAYIQSILDELLESEQY